MTRTTGFRGLRAPAQEVHVFSLELLHVLGNQADFSERDPGSFRQSPHEAVLFVGLSQCTDPLALGDELFVPRLESPTGLRVMGRLLMAQGFRNGRDELIVREGLGQVVGNPCLHGLYG